ncbi:MAG: hypothetical protein V1660_01650 [archaeon]
MPKLTDKISMLEEKFAKKIGDIKIPVPGDGIKGEINVQELLLKMGNSFVDIYYKGDAQKCDYLKKVLKTKLYPAIDYIMTEKEISLLNEEANKIYEKIKTKLKSEKDTYGKGRALKIIDKACEHKVKGISS